MPNPQAIVPQYTPEGELRDAKHRTLSTQEYVNNALVDFQSNVNLQRVDILAQSFSTPGTGTVDSSIFTPPDGSLLVVAQEGANLATGAGVSAMSLVDSEGLTWTQELFVQSDELMDDDFATGLKIWTARVDIGEPMTLTLDCGATNIDHYAISVVAYTGFDIVNPIGTKGTDFTNTAGVDTPADLTLPFAPRGGSEVFAVAAVNNFGSAGGATPGEDWTEIHDLGIVHNWGTLQTQFRRGSTSPLVRWDHVNSSEDPHFGYALGAIEIRTGTEPLDYDEMPSKSTLILLKSGGAWPGVPTARKDIVIIWKGEHPPPGTVSERTLNESGMLLGVDLGLFY